MLDLRRLSLLREVHRRGTLHAVARALSYSPSTISQQLSLLEREAGVALLERSGRRVQLTPQAELLVAGASRLLDEMERLEASLVPSTQEVTGTVRLAVFQSAALGIVPQALTLLAVEHPRVRLEITQREPENALDEVWAREFDLVIAEEYPAHAAPRRRELDRVPLGRDALRLGVPTGSGIRSLADAAEHAWVMEPRGTASRHWAEQSCRLAGFEPDVRFETADLQAHIRLVEAGHAAALLPDLVWGGRPPTVELVTLEGDPHRTIFTSTRAAAAARPAIVAVRGLLARGLG
ncbi:MAG: LysR substrate-binding domain-containing protein [Microcella sp.]|uniref:LysR substrate-binding domain-containing protein n=1 Tax=Microcella sp. TaxID=1913979 RepID=UPI0033164496